MIFSHYIYVDLAKSPTVDIHAAEPAEGSNAEMSQTNKVKGNKVKHNSGMLFVLLLCHLSTLNAQGISMIQPLPVQNEIDRSSYPIPGCQVLWKQEMLLNKYVSEHPSVLQAKRLAKANAWNFGVGDRKSWWATNLVNNTEYQVPSTCRAVGINAYYFVEDSIWNSSRVNQTAVDSIQTAFDLRCPASPTKGIFQMDVDAFGNPPNVDNDSRIIILILDIKDGFSGSGGYVAGYFSSVNEYPDGAILGRRSNYAEIYHVDANPADLTTQYGRNSAAATTAHEFQHMIHFNYDPYELTFVNESCSKVAELVCGYSLSSPALYTNNTDVYLLGWNSTLDDYSRAQRWALYLWNQFPNGYLKQLVANTGTGITGIDNALTLYNPTTNRRFSDIFRDWLVANQLNDASIDPKYAYTFSSSLTKPTAILYPTPYGVSQTASVNRLAADYITFNNGSNLSIKFSSGSSSVSVKAIESGPVSKRVIDVPVGSLFAEPAFGTTYSSITFVIINSSYIDNASYTYQTSSGGGVQTFETKYDNGIGLGYLTSLSTNDTAGVYFDAIPGATLDSIRIAFSLPGSISIGLYRYTGAFRPTPLGSVLVPMSTLTVPLDMMNFTPTSEGTTKWVTKDLRGYDISAGQSFVVAAAIGTIPTIPGLLVTQEAYTGSADHSYTYLNNPGGSSSPNWFFLTGSGNTALCLYMIRAYSHSGTASEPSSPVLISPAHQSTGISTVPTLTWNASTGANSYHIQVATAGNFLTTVVDDSTLVGTSRTVGPLSSNTIYYWRVSAKNVYGTTSYSPTWSFTTIVAAPATPTLAVPANGASNQSINNTLIWNSSTGAATYRVQVSTSTSFATTLLDDTTLVGTTRQIGPLSNNTTYYWRVSASNAGGTSAWSTRWSFTTVMQVPLVTLSLPTTTAVVGSGVAIPITVTGFNSVGAVSLTVTFDNTVLTYTGLTGAPAGTNATAAAVANPNGRVVISWFGLTPLNIGTGTLLNLLFTFKGDSCALTFTNTIPSSVTDSLGNNLLASYTNGKITRTPGVSVSGTITYGIGSTPVGGAVVALVAQGGTVTSAQSSSTGGYSFTGLSSGTYILTVTKIGDYPTSYTNASDALKAALFAINSSAIPTSLAQLAADVNNDGTINAADALQIVLRYVGTLTSFAKGDWVFVPAQTTINVGAANVTDNVQAIAVGDVNVDAVPSNGTFFVKSDGLSQSVVPMTGGSLQTNSVDVFDVPIRVKGTTSIGSVSLSFQYPIDAATFVGVSGPEGMLSATNNGVVRVAWFSAERALHLKENDVVLTIRFKPTGRIKDFNLTLDPTSQITDDLATVLTCVGIEIPTIDASVPTEFALGQNYPNPFNPSTMISYQVPNTANVSLRIFNTLGQVVATLVGEKKETGYYTVKWTANVPSGIYFYRLQTEAFVQTMKMILLK